MSYRGKVRSIVRSGWVGGREIKEITLMQFILRVNVHYSLYSYSTSYVASHYHSRLLRKYHFAFKVMVALVPCAEFIVGRKEGDVGDAITPGWEGLM